VVNIDFTQSLTLNWIIVGFLFEVGALAAGVMWSVITGFFNRGERNK